MALTCTYTTTSSSTPVTVTYDTYSDIKSYVTQSRSLMEALKTITLSGKGDDTSASSLFGADKRGGLDSLTSVDLSNLDTSNVTNMRYMFDDCSSLTSLDVSNFDTSNVTNMQGMFCGCSSLTTIYCNDDWHTSTATSSTYMFKRCTSLVGAIAYDSSKIDVNYANPTTGYFTTIILDIPVYFNDTHLTEMYYNGTKLDHLYYNGTQIY